MYSYRILTNQELAEAIDYARKYADPAYAQHKLFEAQLKDLLHAQARRSIDEKGPEK